MKNILLIGLGRFGKHIAIQSSQLGHEIMAVDLDEERVNDALPYVTNAQIGVCTSFQVLLEFRDRLLLKMYSSILHTQEILPWTPL